MAHLEELLSNVTNHHILKNLPATIELSRKHSSAQAMLKVYEDDVVALWMNQHVSKAGLSSFCNTIFRYQKWIIAF